MADAKKSSATKEAESPWAEEARDLVRAFAGGFLFGVPLLYTMEMWWLGTYVAPQFIFSALILSLALNYLLIRFAGFKEATSFPSAALDAVEAVAVGIVAAAVVLLVLDRIDLATPPYIAVSRIVVEALPFSIGASFANAILRRRDAGRTGDPSAENQDELSATWQDVAATTVGAVLLCLSVAPTEEIQMLAFQMTPWHELALVVLTLVTTYAIVFEAGFGDVEKRRQSAGLFQSPFTETALSYLIALVVSAVLLTLFQRLAPTDAWFVAYSQVLVLGFPAAIGGAAGRLVI